MILKFRAYEKSDNKMYKCIVGNNDTEDDEFICPLIYVKQRGWVHSDTCIVMQYTGLKDCKGVEIYEGDILAKECFWWIIVEYDKGSFMARDFDKTRYNNKILNKHLSDCNLDGWRVIGNIYQNYK